MKIVKIISVFLLLSVLLSSVYFGLQFYKLKDVHDTSEREQYIPKDNDESGNSVLNYNFKDKDKRPFTVLLLGTDSNTIKSGRTDTIMLAVVDPKKEKVKILSFPRDTRMEIAGKDKVDKVNHSFNYGVSTTISTIENYLNIPVDYYMLINLQGFVDLVNEIGGIEIDVEHDISFHDRLQKERFNIYKGVQTLDGRQSLNYSRYRGDADGDFGRNRRQRQVLTGMIESSTKIANVTKITNIFSILGDNARTDLSLDKTLKLAIQFSDIKSEDIEAIKMEASPVSIDGISYVQVSDEEHERIKELLKNILLEKKGDEKTSANNILNKSE